MKLKYENFDGLDHPLDVKGNVVSINSLNVVKLKQDLNQVK